MTSGFCPPAPDPDGFSAQDAATQLRGALRLPASNPSFTHWLFDHIDLHFHPDAPLLPPSAFSCAAAVSATDKYTDILGGTAFATTLPQIYAENAAHITSVTMDMLFLPTSNLNGIVAGYSLAAGRQGDDYLIPFNNGLLRGRFLFDIAHKHLICVIGDLGPTTTGIISITWHPDHRRSRLFFTVPKDDYTFENLPTRVLVHTKNVEVKVESADGVPFATPTGPSSSASEPQPTPVHMDGILDFLADPDVFTGDQPASPSSLHLTTESALSTHDLCGLEDVSQVLDAKEQVVDLSNVFSSSSHTTTDELRLTTPEPSPQGAFDVASLGAFDMSTLSESIGEMVSMMEGKFFTPRLRRDVLDPITGEIVARRTGEMRANLVRADKMCGDRLRTSVAQVYYASTLSVSPDGPLASLELARRRPQHIESGAAAPLSPSAFLSGKEAAAATTTTSDKGSTSDLCTIGKRRRSQLPLAIAPLHAPLPSCEHCTSTSAAAVTAHQAADAEARREAKREEKKRRNRLSAARSTERRKAREKAQWDELRELKGRMSKLRETEQKLAEENRELKALHENKEREVQAGARSLYAA